MVPSPTLFLASLPSPMMLTLPGLPSRPSWLHPPQGCAGKCSTTISLRGKTWFIGFADCWGGNSHAIADFKLPIWSLKAELGRNVGNWLLQATLNGFSLFLTPPVCSNSISSRMSSLITAYCLLSWNPVHFSSLHFGSKPTWTFLFLHLFLPQAQYHEDRDHIFFFLWVFGAPSTVPGT